MGDTTEIFLLLYDVCTNKRWSFFCCIFISSFLFLIPPNFFFHTYVTLLNYIFFLSHVIDKFSHFFHSISTLRTPLEHIDDELVGNSFDFIRDSLNWIMLLLLSIVRVFLQIVFVHLINLVFFLLHIYTRTHTYLYSLYYIV